MIKQTKGDKTKQHLYQCAINLFKEKGYEHVSVDEIVRTAGTAKGTFYIYFKSKVDIISHMLHKYDHYYDELEKALDPANKATANLFIIIQSSCQFTKDNIGLDLLRVLYANQLTDPSQQGDLHNNRSLYRVINNLVEQAQLAGDFNRQIDAKLTSEWIVRSIRGTFYEWCLQDGAFDLSEQCLDYIKIFCKGLK